MIEHLRLRGCVVAVVTVCVCAAAVESPAASRVDSTIKTDGTVALEGRSGVFKGLGVPAPKAPQDPDKEPPCEGKAGSMQGPRVFAEQFCATPQACDRADAADILSAVCEADYGRVCASREDCTDPEQCVISHPVVRATAGAAVVGAKCMDLGPSDNCPDEGAPNLCLCGVNLGNRRTVLECHCDCR